MAFRLLPEAEDDLGSIALDIAADSPMAARRWYDSMLERCEKLGKMPGMGFARADVHPDLRVLPAGKYLIREAQDGADIVRVIHGARRWQDLI